MRPDPALVAAVVAAAAQRSVWWAQAACSGMDIHEFADDPSLDARRACARCPVRTECLADEATVPSDEILGYRGGMRPESRRRLLVVVRRRLPGDFRRQAVLHAVRTGVAVREVAAAYGIPVRTVYRWLAQERLSA